MWPLREFTPRAQEPSGSTPTGVLKDTREMQRPSSYVKWQDILYTV